MHRGTNICIVKNDFTKIGNRKKKKATLTVPGWWSILFGSQMCLSAGGCLGDWAWSRNYTDFSDYRVLQATLFKFFLNLEIWTHPFLKNGSIFWLFHLSKCLRANYAQFQDHDFVLGSLADFPAVFLEEFLADKHLLCLSVFCQAQLAELLPTQKEIKKKVDRLREKKINNVSDEGWKGNCI